MPDGDTLRELSRSGRGGKASRHPSAEPAPPDQAEESPGGALRRQVSHRARQAGDVQVELRPAPRSQADPPAPVGQVRQTTLRATSTINSVASPIVRPRNKPSSSPIQTAFL